MFDQESHPHEGSDRGGSAYLDQEDVEAAHFTLFEGAPLKRCALFVQLVRRADTKSGTDSCIGCRLDARYSRTTTR
jgi:hypothetical protein